MKNLVGEVQACGVPESCNRFSCLPPPQSDSRCKVFVPVISYMLHMSKD